MINLLKKIFLALFLGICITTYIIQNQEDFKITIQKKIEQMLKKILDCDFKCKVKNINIFYPFVELTDVKVIDNQNWNWTCKNLKFNCSWIDYLLTGKFNASVIMNKTDVYSLFENGNLSIFPHIKKLIISNNPDLPVKIRNLKLNKSNIKILENELNFRSQLDFNCELKSTRDSSKIILYLTNAFIEKDKNPCVNEMSGMIQINIPQLQTDKSTIEINGLCNLPILKIEENRCFFSGKWTENKKFIKIGTIDGKLNLDCLNFYIKKDKLNLDLIFQASIKYLQKIFNINFDPIIDGDCTLNLTTDVRNEELIGECFIKNITYNSQPLAIIDELKLDFNKNNQNWNGKLSINKAEQSIFFGNWKLEDNNSLIKLFYSCSLLKSEKNIDASGEVILSDFIKAKGNIDKQFFELNCQVKPNFIIKKFSYFNDQGQECIRIRSNPNKFKNNENLENFTISIYFEHIQNWLLDVFNQDLMGQGEIIIEGNYYNNKFNGKIHSNNLNIRVPKFYNIIKEIEGKIDIDTHNKEISINNTILKMYKGNLECNNAKIIFNSFYPNLIYIPITIKNNLISWKKDIIATLSGKILIKKLLNMPPNISGFLFIENAQIKNNIFSNEFRNELFGKYDLPNKNQINIEIDLSIISKDTIKIKTPFLNTKIKTDLKVFNNLSKPKILGSIELTKGTIIFPYKNLNIVSGNINFLPNQISDPIINLIAKNKIKKFNIMMHVTGSAQDQNIKFESSPPLSDEQIIALLLVGSENGSMNMVMPSIVMKNVKNIISGSSQTHTNIKKYFDTLLKPLKYIKISPNFNSETGRPGFKGSIDIFSDRLRAELQKNFTLSEDTRFDIEYSLTDEISLKATKDERGDLGGEIEMRWKF